MNLRKYIDSCHEIVPGVYEYGGFNVNIRSFRKEPDGTFKFVRDHIALPEINSVEAEHSVIMGVKGTDRIMTSSDKNIVLTIDYYTTMYTACRYITDDLFIKYKNLGDSAFNEIEYEVKEKVEKTGENPETYNIDISLENCGKLDYETMFKRIQIALRESAHIGPDYIVKQINTYRTSKKFCIRVYV